MSRRPEVALPNGGPFVSTEVDPAKIHGVAAYAAGIQARRGGLPKQEMPLNQPRPLIPNLAGGPSNGPGGGTMADFARMERQATAAGYTPAPTGGIIEEGAPVAAPAAVRPTAASLGLAPMDMLPPAAKEDPAYVAGHGSEFACNQPMLAAKYGVIRNGQRIAPQGLGGSSRASLSPKTIQDLQTLKGLSEGAAAPGLDQSEEEARRAVDSGMGGAAARVGNEPGDRSTKTVTDAEREALFKSAIDQMDAFEFNQWRQLTMRQILHSDDERKLIESRLKPLDVGDIIRDGVIRQRIPIVPGKYEITLQNYDGETDMALKRLVMLESKSVAVGDQYHLDKYSFMTVAVGLHKVNDKEYPSIVDSKGDFNDELFLKKFNMVMKLPLDMLASIGINLFWFSVRVRKLYSASAVGNG